MKKISAIIFCLTYLYLNSYAQNVRYEYNKVALSKSEIQQNNTVGIDSLFDVSMATKSKIGRPAWPNPSSLPVPDKDKRKVELSQPNVTTKTISQVTSPLPATSFPALGDNNGQLPPDTHGAAGPNHLMTTLNTEIRIQNKTGGILSTQSLSSFWSSFSFTTIFDPRIHYDPYANRWIFVVCIDKNSANSSILIAVSATSNPTGNWYQWQVDADAGNTSWVDYPTVGFNNRWIVVSANMFGNVANAWAGPQIIVFDKSNLYSNGVGTHSSIYPGTNVGATFAPAVTYDNSVSTMFLVQDYNGNSSGWGYLGLSKITGTTATPTFSLHYSFPATANAWNWSPGAADFAPQLGSTQKIQNNDSKMQNVVYRNASLWCTHHIFLPTTSSSHTAVQWWELDTLGSIVQRSRIEDLSANTFYAFPSIAVNSNDDVLIGYSSFSATQYASGTYSYRNHNDPINTMQSDYKYISGLASYYKTHSGTRNRWGDYSATIVDPQNDHDFWTIQEYAALQSAGIDRWGTYWANVQCQLPAAPLSVSWNQPHCEGSTIPYTASPVAGATSYTWTIQSGIGWAGSSVSNMVNFTAGSTAAYIDVSANNACGAGPSYGFWSFAAPLPLSTFTTSATVTDVGVPITITGDDTDPTTNFNWNFDNGNAMPGAGQGPHTVDWSIQGVKNVMLTTSRNGCTAAQTTQTITVNTPSAIDALEEAGIKIFPNPVKSSFQIECDVVIGEISLYNGLGQLMEQHHNIQNNAFIDMGDFPSGTYFLKFGALDKAVVVRLVKE